MSTYICLLRGINVGGNNMIKMLELKSCFEEQGFKNVHSYIQSGNIIFEAPIEDVLGLIAKIEQAIQKKFSLLVRVVVIESEYFKKMVTGAPKGWGGDPDWKYNFIFIKPPYDMKKIVEEIGILKPDIEVLKVSDGVLYQGVLFKAFGRSRTGKLASMPVYQQMTIRNYNTANKLLALLEN